MKEEPLNQFIRRQLEEFGFPLDYRIYTLLKRNGGLTRSKILESLQEPWSTIYDSLVRLEKKQRVKRITIQTKKHGRPNIVWKTP